MWSFGHANLGDRWISVALPPPALLRPTFFAGLWRAEIANNHGLCAKTSALRPTLHTPTNSIGDGTRDIGEIALASSFSVRNCVDRIKNSLRESLRLDPIERPHIAVVLDNIMKHSDNPLVRPSHLQHDPQWVQDVRCTPLVILASMRCLRSASASASR